MIARLKRIRINPLLVIMLGILSLLWPVTSTLWNNWQAKIDAKVYEKKVTAQTREVRERHLNEAREYNRKRDGFLPKDPYSGTTPHDSPLYREYLRVLSTPEGPMGVVKIPKINVDLPFWHGTDYDTLQRAAGHLFESDLPVGGKNRHAVITAHTGLAFSTMFDQLTEMKRGDMFYIYVQDETMQYRVVEINVIEPHDIRLLQRRPGRDLVTLVTCTPYGINSHRLLVTGERVLPDPSGPPGSGFQWTWWMTLFSFGIAMSLLILLLLAFGRRREKEDPHVPRHRYQAPQSSSAGANGSARAQSFSAEDAHSPSGGEGVFPFCGEASGGGSGTE